MKNERMPPEIYQGGNKQWKIWIKRYRICGINSEGVHRISHEGRDSALHGKHDGKRNGYYERGLGIRYGKIDDLMVQRNRNNNFQTAIFERYQRNIGIDDLVVSMYSNGISTRKMFEIPKETFHNRYSKSTISRITEITVP